ncbi:TolB amino-terminal domain-containing protein [Fodinibius roseus]|uniref:TolB amino-terminal domain-containing protein n=1 Tax=Fodinibius roseus TaxID=1194090 RepID=A0A1M4UHJ3_9BACT|nr:BTAD domain-containing putative transcriptional regulator [Fodinibius roseus]SHE56167.1 TolB amino-terminal domain-containing protein [Fodinibius roseus]
MVEFHLLGPAELRDESGELVQSFLSGPKRLALLVYLTLDRPRGFKRRDSLLPLFWPNLGQKSARNALSNMLYQIRKALGNEIIINRGKEEIEVGSIWCDVTAFEEARKKEEYKRALELYRSNLLEGFHVPDASPEFGQWLDLERRRVQRGYREVLEKLAQQAEKRGDPEAAAKWWYKYIAEDPYDSRATRRLMEALVAADKRPEAIRIAENHAGLLKKEFGASATEKTEKLTGGLEKAAAKFKDRRETSQPGDLNTRTIAVLPFETLDSNGEIKPLATGIHNDLLTKLSNISALTVIARNSVLRYRGTEASVAKVARELVVGTIVEGTVQQARNRVRLNVQLTDTRNEQLLWAETYERELTAENLFQIQSELAEKVTDTLQAQLTPEEKKRIQEKPTENLEAYHMYVQGQTHLAHRTERGINRALKYFQRAVEIDSSYALAWAGIAESLVLLKFYEYPLPENTPDAMEAVRHALELDPELGEAHASLGILHASLQEGPEAIRELEQAIKFQPGYAEAHAWLGWTYMITGRLKEALKPAERAAELDPRAPYTRVYLGKTYLADGQYEKGLYEAKSARQMQPEFTLNHYMEGLALYHLDRFSEALLAMKEAQSLVRSKGTPAETEILAILALNYIASDNPTKAEKLLPKINKMEDWFSSGLVHAALGEDKDTFKAFNKIKNWGYFSTALFRYFFPKLLEPIRDDARSRQIIQQINEDWGLNC